MFLHETGMFPDLLKQTQSHFNIPIEIIEKDYYVMVLLSLIVKECPFLVFKGGTSLSKCFHAINRFSEDIDLGSATHMPNGQRQSVKQTIQTAVSTLGLNLVNADEIRSRRDFNRYRVMYFTDHALQTVQPQVVVETFFPIKTFPTQNLKTQAFIGEFLEITGHQDMAKEFGLEAFSVCVQSIERTLVDKIYALGDYFLQNNIFEHSRHIYDIHRLWPLVNRQEVLRLVPLVRAERQLDTHGCESVKEGININQILNEIVEENVFREDYNEITVQLLYESLPYDQAIQTLREIAGLKWF